MHNLDPCDRKIGDRKMGACLFSCSEMSLAMNWIWPARTRRNQVRRSSILRDGAHSRFEFATQGVAMVVRRVARNPQRITDHHFATGKGLGNLKAIPTAENPFATAPATDGQNRQPGQLC